LTFLFFRGLSLFFGAFSLVNGIGEVEYACFLLLKKIFAPRVLHLGQGKVTILSSVDLEKLP
jgi:hypothetical protein